MNILNLNVYRHHSLEKVPYLEKVMVEDTTKTHEIVLKKLKEIVEDDLCINIENEKWDKVEKKLSLFWNGKTDGLCFDIEAYNDDSETVKNVIFYAIVNMKRNTVIYSPHLDLRKNENRWVSFQYTDQDLIKEKIKELEKLPKDELVKMLLLKMV